MDIIQLYQDYSVDFLTEGNKHCSPGWVNTHCPHCEGSRDYHLGYNLSDNFFTCYRCGWHPVVPTIARLISINELDVRSIIKNYGMLIPILRKEPVVKIRAKTHRLPSSTTPLSNQHRLYLERRGYDVDRIESLWHLLGTGPVSKLDNINFRQRIIIPILWSGQEVSFTSRDITGRNDLRYITCPKDRELINHKTILYGLQEYWKETGICVEGPFDAMRLGPSSFATFGIKWTHLQLREISKRFKRIFVIYDNEPQAQTQADKLVSELRFRGKEVYGIQLENDTDPGSMKQSDADYLVKQLIT